MKLVQTTDRVINAIQKNAEEAITSVSNASILKAVYVAVAVLITVDNIIQHGLGRRFQYFEVVSRDANTNVWLSQTVNTLPDKQIILKASANANIILRLS